MTAIETYQPLPLDDTFSVLGPAADLAGRLARTEFVPVAFRNKPEAVLAAILTAREVGLKPMQGLAQINVIEGRPSLSALGQRTLILAHGHEIWPEKSTPIECVMCGRRRGEEYIYRVTWTIDDARRAGLVNDRRPNWNRYPKQMLLARASTDLAKLGFADVIGGFGQTTEELEDEQEPNTNGTSASTGGRARRRRQPQAQPTEDTATPATSESTNEQQTTNEQQAHSPASQSDEATGQLDQRAISQDSSPSGAASVTSDERAGDVQMTPTMTLAQEIAMLCRQADIDRRELVFAVTGKLRARDVTRPEAAEVLTAARAIASGDSVMHHDDAGRPFIVIVEHEPSADEWDVPLDDEDV